VSYSIGLDVSKSTIQVHISKNGQDLEIVNDSKGLQTLYAKLKKLYKKEIDDVVFVFEPTGSYSELLRKFCAQKRIQCFIINPKRFSNYAKALGEEIKNDRIDARVLAKAVVLAKEGEIEIPLYDETVETLKELMGYYKFTVKQTAQLRNHLESLKAKGGSRFAIKELEASMKASKVKEKKIIEQVQGMIDSDEQHRQAYENILSIMGVGQIGAIALLHLFLKYPEANQRQITSLAGLNPVYRQSGTSVQSRFRISKSGSKLYRGSLFMGVMSAVRYDKNFQAFYDRLKAKGKHTTQAQIAVMRKMIIVAHSLYKNNRKYDPEFALKKIGYVG
jgi:transposase